VNQQFDKSNQWINDRTIMLGPSGSFAYGTNIETSDQDFIGVCIPPIEYFLGTEHFNEYRNNRGKNFKNTKEDVDVNILHINKFVSNAMQGVPQAIELLFLQEDQYLTLTPEGKRLVDNRHLFLSKQLFFKLGGFARSQIIRMEKSTKSRTDIVEEFGYDTKYFMHAMRLLTSGIEIFETGDYSTLRPNREFLIECRKGKYTFDQAVKLVKDYDERFKEAHDQTDLPKSPDHKKVNELLISINNNYLRKT